MVNLMQSQSSESSPEHLIVDVKDHDIDVPGDIGGNSLPFWKQDSVKIWLYVLAGAILILITVFALLSKQTSLFQGRTKLNSPNVTTVEDPNDAEVDGYNSQAANTENQNEDDNTDNETDPETGEGDFVETNTDAEDNQANINDYLDDDGDISNNGETSAQTETDNHTETDQAETEINDGLDDLWSDGLDILDPEDNAEPVYADPFENSDTFEGYGAAHAETTIDSEITQDENDNFGIGPSLNSNTDDSVLTSPDVQGDTGPTPLLAMIPAMFYAFFSSRKKQIN